MEQSQLERTVQKLRSFEELPSFKEVKFLQESADMRSKQYNPALVSWFYICEQNHVYHAHSAEFVDALAAEIMLLGNPSSVEICAGNGKLSYHLRKRGVDITPIDDNSWNLSKNTIVRRMSHKEALRKLKPNLVVGCWVPHGDDQSENGLNIYGDVLNSGARRYIDLGEEMDTCPLKEKLWERKDLIKLPLPKVEGYMVGLGDFPDSKKSQATMFTI